MKTRRIFSALLILLLVTGFSAAGHAAPAETIVAIVHQDNPLENIHSTALARIYKGRLKRWPDGKRIVVFNRPIQSDIRAKFYKQALKAGPAKRFRPSKSPIPFRMRQVKSHLAAKKFVARIPNAIAYIYLHEADDSIKILKIDGLSPGDEGYKLR